MKNRLIKFRIWCPKHEAFAYYKDLLDTIVELNGNTKNVGYWEHFDLGKDLIFQQFTGLVDRTGKEIYEGDRIKITYGDGSWSWYIVEYRSMGFWMIDEEGDCYVFHPETYNLTVEGTIFDTLEINN